MRSYVLHLRLELFSSYTFSTVKNELKLDEIFKNIELHKSLWT